MYHHAWLVHMCMLCVWVFEIQINSLPWVQRYAPGKPPFLLYVVGYVRHSEDSLLLLLLLN